MRGLALAATLVVLSFASVPAHAQTAAGGTSQADAAAQNEQRDQQLKVAAGVDLYKGGDLAGATKAFQGVLADHPDNVDAQSWLGFLFLRQNQADQAVPLLEKASTARPNDVEIANNLGNAYMATNMLDKAVDQFKKVNGMNPSLFEPLYNIGTIYLQQKNYSAAEDTLIKAATMKPDDAFVMNNLGIAYENDNKMDRAAFAYAKASDMKMDNAVFAKNAGFAYLRLRRPQDGVMYLERARGIDGSDQNIQIALADAYTRVGRKDDAKKLYDSMGMSMGNSAAYWFNTGVVRAQSNDLQGARDAYRKALAIDSNDIDTLNNLGLVEFKLGNYKESRTIFDRLSGIDPNSSSAKLNLAAADVKLGNYAEAISIWKPIVQADPSRNDLRLQLANAMWATKDYDGAKKGYMMVLARDHGNADALNGMGLSYLRDNRLKEAETAFRSSIQANPKLTAAYNNLAITMERRNHKKDAIMVLQKAHKMDPNNKDVNASLKRMRG